MSLSNEEAFQLWLFILIGPGAVSTNLRLVGWRAEGHPSLGHRHEKANLERERCP